MSIRKNLEYLRKQKKLSQEELAYKLGVSRQAVSKWESGAAFPETEKMMSICKIFDCSLDDLINGDIAQLEIDKDRKYTFNDLVNEIRFSLDSPNQIIEYKKTRTKEVNVGLSLYSEIDIAIIKKISIVGSFGFSTFKKVGSNSILGITTLYNFK